MIIARYIYLLTLVICIIVGFLKSKSLEKPYLNLWFLLIFTFINEVISTALNNYKLNVNIQLHFFTVFEYYIYTRIYIAIFNDLAIKRLLNISVIILFVLQLINSLYFQPLIESNTNVLLIESLFLVFISLLYFNKIAKNILTDNILKSEAFWLNSFIFIFYSYNINIWGLHSLKVYKWLNPPFYIYDIMMGLCIIMYIVFGIILMINKKTTQNE